MLFKTPSSPHFGHSDNVEMVMLRVLMALVPGAAAMVWYFGWGILVNMALASGTAIATEALVIKLRGRPAWPAVRDLSAVVTAVLLALALPPLLPWWITVLGTAFAIVIVKQLYGGIGYNPFNPAMAGYVFLLISYPIEMTGWLPPRMLNENPLNFLETLGYVFTGTLPPQLTWDAITMATPLDAMRESLDLDKMISEIRQSPLWGDFGGKGWEWVGNWFFLGGIWLIYKRAITWHVPVSMLASLLIIASIFFVLDPETHPFALFHLFSGGAMLGAFFIATDPVSGCTTNRGKLIFGAMIGVLIFVIRTWGGYPDAVAFSVLLMNMAAPIIDYYAQPRVFGHDKDQQHG